MKSLELFFRYSHILAGAIVLLTGFLAIIIKPRGSKFHKKVGILYFYGMLWIFISSLAMNCFRFNFFLSMISVFSFYLSFSAYRVLKRKTQDKIIWIDWFGSIFTLFAGVIFVLFGAYIIYSSQNIVLAFLSMFFGAFTIWTAWSDIVIFRKTEYDDKMWWYFHHAGNMMGSFIAAVTAFSVNVLPKFTPNSDINWIYWLLPTAVGTPILIRILKKEKLKFNSKR